MDNKSGGAELWISWENTGMELDTFNYNIFVFFFCKAIMYNVHVASSENASYVTKLCNIAQSQNFNIA